MFGHWCPPARGVVPGLDSECATCGAGKEKDMSEDDGDEKENPKILKPGDLVHHVTGGPNMAVRTPQIDGTVTCEWWDPDEREFRVASFRNETLRHREG